MKCKSKKFGGRFKNHLIVLHFVLPLSQTAPVMETLQRIFRKVFPVMKNKYILTLLIFLVWITFFDQNNLVDRFRQMNRQEELKDEKEYYLNKIHRDSVKLHQLKTNKENLEEFAREEYYMKRENEDIFIIVEEE